MAGGNEWAGCPSHIRVARGRSAVNTVVDGRGSERRCRLRCRQQSREHSGNVATNVLGAEGHRIGDDSDVGMLGHGSVGAGDPLALLRPGAFNAIAGGCAVRRAARLRRSSARGHSDVLNLRTRRSARARTSASPDVARLRAARGRRCDGISQRIEPMMTRCVSQGASSLWRGS